MVSGSRAHCQIALNSSTLSKTIEWNFLEFIWWRAMKNVFSIYTKKVSIILFQNSKIFPELWRLEVQHQAFHKKIRNSTLYHTRNTNLVWPVEIIQCIDWICEILREKKEHLGGHPEVSKWAKISEKRNLRHLQKPWI